MIQQDTYLIHMVATHIYNNKKTKWVFLHSPILPDIGVECAHSFILIQYILESDENSVRILV